MMQVMRKKMGSLVIVGFAIFIGAAFIFSGGLPTTPLTGGIRGEAGTVNGEAISLEELNRVYNAQMQQMQEMDIPSEQLEMFVNRDRIFDSLVRQKLMLQAAREVGVSVSDGEVRDRIQEIDAFHVDERFDPLQYREVLEASGMTPGRFEDEIRDEILVNRFQEYLTDQVKVTEEEVRQEFFETEDQRKVSYVLISPSAIRKQMDVSEQELEAYLEEEPNRNLVEQRYEIEKEGQYADQSLEEVDQQIAKELILEEKRDEVKSEQDELAQTVLEQIDPEDPDPRKTQSLLGPYDLAFQQSSFLNHQSTQLEDVGSVPELMEDAFSPDHPIEPEKGGAVKRYDLGQGVLIAYVSDRDEADFEELDEEASRSIAERIQSEKQGALFSTWMEGLMESAEIKKGEALQDEGRAE